MVIKIVQDTGDSGRRALTWRLFAAQFFAMLRTPPVVLTLCLIIATPYVLPASLYAFLKSIWLTGSLLFAYAGIAAGVGVFLASLGLHIRMALNARRRRAAGLPLSTSFWTLPGLIVPLTLITAPATVAILLCPDQSSTATVYSRHYHRPLSGHEELGELLRRLEKRGLLNPITDSQK